MGIRMIVLLLLWFGCNLRIKSLRIVFTNPVIAMEWDFANERIWGLGTSGGGSEREKVGSKQAHSSTILCIRSSIDDAEK
jgi:hypothetical protein